MSQDILNGLELLKLVIPDDGCELEERQVAQFTTRIQEWVLEATKTQARREQRAFCRVVERALMEYLFRHSVPSTAFHEELHKRLSIREGE